MEKVTGKIQQIIFMPGRPEIEVRLEDTQSPYWVVPEKVTLDDNPLSPADLVKRICVEDGPNVYYEATVFPRVDRYGASLILEVRSVPYSR